VRRASGGAWCSGDRAGPPHEAERGQGGRNLGDSTPSRDQGLAAAAGAELEAPVAHADGKNWVRVWRRARGDVCPTTPEGVYAAFSEQCLVA